ncbi:DUF5687 family protein [Leyella stercorea]|uniref:DUF5687 family protein n=1 Tax=Leyella stercorea TaxID=363265 RepID=UPI003A924501
MKCTIPKFELIRLLLRHRRLADDRSLSAKENKFAKFFILFSILIIIVIYLMGLAVGLSLIVNSDITATATENLCIGIPFLLLIDFNMRFTMQQTPAHIIKPYILLPLPRYTCIDAFIYSSLISKGNFVWFAFFLPYALMSIVFSYGLATATLTMLLCLVLILVNSQWYSIARTLINRSVIWWILPIIIYGIEAMPLYIGSNAGWNQFCSLYSTVGTMLDKHNVLPIFIAIVVLVGITAFNRRLQYVSIERELMRTEVKKSVKKVNKFAFFEKYGEIGLFMQLEIKLLLRNATPKKALKSGFFTMAMICAFIVLSDVYDSSGMTNFWGLYAFMIFGTMNLLGLMSYEGNYIDCMLTHRENILSLLKAKYVFYSLLLIAPFLLMLPAVISGKWSLLMLVSYLIFTMGFQYFIAFQTAVYNKITVPLNTKMTDKAGLKTNYIQLVLVAIVFIVPNILVNILQSLFSENIAYLTMLLIGLGFIATHRLWLRNVYNRLMKRKYANLEGFISSRQ